MDLDGFDFLDHLTSGEHFGTDWVLALHLKNHQKWCTR